MNLQTTIVWKDSKSKLWWMSYFIYFNDNCRYLCVANSGAILQTIGMNYYCLCNNKYNRKYYIHEEDR